MAILDNRSKTHSVLTGFNIALLNIVRRFSAVFFILLSLQLMYFQPKETLEKTTLEFTGNITNVFITIFKTGIRAIQGVVESVDYMHDLKEENIALKLENARLRGVEEKFSILKSENFSLKRQLNFISEPQYNSAPARLVTVSASVYKDTAIIHAGSSKGVLQDQIVINDNGLVGRVIETSRHFSKIMLITDFGSRIPVISSHSRLQAVVAGIGESRARLLYLPDTSLLQVGEILMTSGDGRLYPSGLPVARVSKIIEDEVYVTPLVDPGKIDFVSMITDLPLARDSH